MRNAFFFGLLIALCGMAAGQTGPATQAQYAGACIVGAIPSKDCPSSLMTHQAQIAPMVLPPPPPLSTVTDQLDFKKQIDKIFQEGAKTFNDRLSKEVSQPQPLAFPAPPRQEFEGPERESSDVTTASPTHGSAMVCETFACTFARGVAATQQAQHECERRAQEEAQEAQRDREEAQAVHSCGEAVKFFSKLVNQETTLIKAGRPVPQSLDDSVHSANGVVHATCGF